ncbi:MAG TPA: GYF domain-containing protein [Candidatus Sumerlaeota bacterium]|nr:GYF domain-containing protein [Candidatus Sumerlaeota bacterium]
MWYYQLNKATIGPVDSYTLIGLLLNGTIDSMTLVKEIEMPGWVYVCQTELFEEYLSATQADYTQAGCAAQQSETLTRMLDEIETDRVWQMYGVCDHQDALESARASRNSLLVAGASMALFLAFQFLLSA